MRRFFLGAFPLGHIHTRALNTVVGKGTLSRRCMVAKFAIAPLPTRSFFTHVPRGHGAFSGASFIARAA